MSTRIAATVMTLALSTPAHALSWNNCDPAAPNLTSFGVALPIVLGETAWVTGKFNLSRDITAIYDVTVVVEHEVNGRKLPCLGPWLGSCTYENACSLPLPEWPLGPVIPVRCPYRSGVMTIDIPVPMPTSDEHAALLLGVNTLRIKHVDPDGSTSACIELTGEVYRCDDPSCDPETQSCEPQYCVD